MFPKWPDFSHPLWPWAMLWWILMMSLNIASVIFTVKIFLFILLQVSGLLILVKERIFPKKCVDTLQKVHKYPLQKDLNEYNQSKNS